MSDKIRFRMEGKLCVLQVIETTDYSYNVRKLSWRDAEATDLIEIGEWIEALRHIRPEPPQDFIKPVEYT